MKKLVMVLMVLCGIGFSFVRATNWSIYNYNNQPIVKVISAPYYNSGLYVENMLNANITANFLNQTQGYSVIQGLQTRDYYPLSFQSGSVVTFNLTVSQNINVVWYEINE